MRTLLGLVLVLASVAPAHAQLTYVGFRAVRFTDTGNLDASFGTAGISDWSFEGDPLFSVNYATLDGQGRIIVVGTHTDRVTFQSRFAVWRLTANGYPDRTFGNGGLAIREFDEDATASAAMVRANGNIIVVGHSGGGFAIACFTETGTTCYWNLAEGVTSFAGFGASALAVIATSDGGFLVGGTATRLTSQGYDSRLALARYLSSGKLDINFSGDGKLLHNLEPTTQWPANNSEVIYGLATTSTGRIVAVGRYVAESTSGEYRMFVNRYLPDGARDYSFAGGVVRPLGNVDAIAGQVIVTSDNRIAVAGSAGWNTLVMRLENDGHLDTSFSRDGWLVQDLAPGMIDASVGLTEYFTDLFVGVGVWQTTSAFPGIVRYNANGTRDTVFGNNGVATAPACSHPLAVGSGVQRFPNPPWLYEPRPVLVYACID